APTPFYLPPRIAGMAWHAAFERPAPSRVPTADQPTQPFPKAFLPPVFPAWREPLRPGSRIDGESRTPMLVAPPPPPTSIAGVAWQRAFDQPAFSASVRA